MGAHDHGAVGDPIAPVGSGSGKPRAWRLERECDILSPPLSTRLTIGSISSGDGNFRDRGVFYSTPHERM